MDLNSIKQRVKNGIFKNIENTLRLLAESGLPINVVPMLYQKKKPFLSKRL